MIERETKALLVAVLMTMALGPATAVADEETRPPPPPKMKPADAIGMLPSGQGDRLQNAMTSLKETEGLLKKHGRGLAALVQARPGDSDVAHRVLEIVHERKQQGCTFIAGLVTQKNRAWVREVIQRFTLLPHCDPLIKAVADILKWVPNPESSSEAAHLLSRVFAIVQESGFAQLDDSACRFVGKGPDGFRRSAIQTILATKPDWGEVCLIRAYRDERQAPAPAPTVRRDMLRAISEYSGVDSIPTLVISLAYEDDKELACELLEEKGVAGANGLVFALRTTNAGSEGVKECLLDKGQAAVPSMLNMLDHRSDVVRSFVVSFLGKHRSTEALQAIKDLFDRGGGKIGKGRLLALMADYPVPEMHEMLEAALVDVREDVRIQALDAIEKSKSHAFDKALLEAAEDDGSAVVRARGLDVCWRLGVEGTQELALRMAQYENPQVAVHAIRILGYGDDSDAVDVLRSALKSRGTDVAEAAIEALWLQTFEDPEEEGEFKAGSNPGKIETGRGVSFEGGRAEVLGDDDQLIVILPGGPGMDFTWARPYLDDLSDDFTMAFLVTDRDGEESEVTLPSPIVRPSTLRSLLRELEKPKAVLVSMGLGGTAALWLATLEPEIVSGVVVVSAALPGHLQDMDDALLARLEEPYKSIVAPLVDGQDLFRADALSRYMARSLATAVIGEEGGPWDVLNVSWEVARTGRAFAVLSRPEVRFEPTEFPGSVLFVLPVEWLDERLMGTYENVRSQDPDRIVVKDMTECGFMPQVTCSSDVVDLIEDFVEEASRGDGE